MAKNPNFIKYSSRSLGIIAKTKSANNGKSPNPTAPNTRGRQRNCGVSLVPTTRHDINSATAVVGNMSAIDRNYNIQTCECYTDKLTAVTSLF